MISNGVRLRTAYMPSELQSGMLMRTSSGIVYGGTRLRVQTISPLTAGSYFSTDALSSVADRLYNYLPSATNWGAVAPFVPTVVGPASPPYYTPFNRPDVTVSFTLSYTASNTVYNSIDTVFPAGAAPSGASVTTTTIVGGTRTTITRVGGIQTNITTLTSGSSGAASVTDLTPWLKTCSLEMPLGGKYSFNATFHQFPAGNAYLDSDGKVIGNQIDELLSTFPSDFDILRYGAGTLNPKIIHHKYDTSRKIFISISVGYGPSKQTWTSPPFAPGAPSYDGYELRWSGEDISVLLEQEYQSMPDIVAKVQPNQTTQTIRGAVATINNIATQYQLDRVLSPQFPDYQIRQLRRQKGRPMDWIDQICKPYQAVRHWEGGLLVLKPIVNPAQASAKFTITGSMITEGSLSESQNESFKNIFTVARFQDNGGYYGSQQCTGGHCIGRTVNITFQEPLTNINLVLNALGPADLRDFVFFNGDKIVGGGPGTSTNFYCPIPATSMKGTYQLGSNQNTGNITQAVGDTQNSPYSTQDYGYSVYVKGSTTSSSADFSPFFVFHAQDNASIGLFGPKPEYDAIQDEIIPNLLVAKAYVAALLLFNIRKIWKQELSTVFINPFISPGDCIAVDDYLTKQSQLHWTVEKVSLSMEEGGEWSQKLELSRGLV